MFLAPELAWDPKMVGRRKRDSARCWMLSLIMNQSINQSINQSTNQASNQPTKQAINQSFWISNPSILKIYIQKHTKNTSPTSSTPLGDLKLQGQVWSVKVDSWPPWQHVAVAPFVVLCCAGDPGCKGLLLCSGVLHHKLRYIYRIL